LYREVAGICRWLRGVTAAEGHDQGPIERDRDPLQGIEIRRTNPTLDPAFDHPSEACPRRKFDARPAATLTDRLDLRTDPCLLFPAAALGLDCKRGSSDAGHDRPMFIRRASLAISCGKALAGARAGPLAHAVAHGVCLMRRNEASPGLPKTRGPAMGHK